jgi:hypothetical protein
METFLLIEPVAEYNNQRYLGWKCGIWGIMAQVWGALNCTFKLCNSRAIKNTKYWSSYILFKFAATAF